VLRNGKYCLLIPIPNTEITESWFTSNNKQIKTQTRFFDSLSTGYRHINLAKKCMEKRKRVGLRLFNSVLLLVLLPQLSHERLKIRLWLSKEAEPYSKSTRNTTIVLKMGLPEYM